MGMVLLWLSSRALEDWIYKFSSSEGGRERERATEGKAKNTRRRDGVKAKTVTGLFYLAAGTLKLYLGGSDFAIVLEYRYSVPLFVSIQIIWP